MRTLGTARVCITPEKTVRLCGFGFRKTVYDTVRKDLYARVYDLREESERVVLLYGDLLWWNPAFVERMRKEIYEKLGIQPSQLLFTASHNHSGPGTGDTFIPLLETVEKEYADVLAKRIIQALREAQESQEEVVMTRSEGSCALNVYRRIMTEQGIQMMPNYQVEPDRTLTVFGFYRTDGSLKGRILHYPCHANLSKDNDLHPDYPGYVLEQLDGETPGSLHLFLQGCTADMRPNCVLGNQFRPGSREDVETFAAYMCEAVQKTVGRETVVGPGMCLAQRFLSLPVEQDFTAHEVENRLGDCREEVRQWAVKVMEKKLRDYEVLELNSLLLGEQKFYFFNAEVSMYYAHAARNRVPGAVCIGYTNGMLGYLSTAEQIRAGGYEPVNSAVYFAVAGTYGEAIQSMIEHAMNLI